MKKTIISLMLLFSVKAFAQTAALPVYDCVQNGTQAVTSGLKSSNYQLGVVPYCSVSVYLTGTTTIATTTPQSPFRANKDGSIPPIYAAVNQGYDVVLSGGISPNTYSSPVTLTGLYPATEFISAHGIVLMQQVVPPVSGQYVIVYPTTYTGNWAGQSAAGGGWIDPPTCIGTSMGTESWGNPVLPSYVLPSNVTAVYAFASTREYVNPSYGGCLGQPTTPAPASFSVSASGTSSVLTPTSTPIWAPVQNTVLLPSVTGENFASQTFSASYGASTPIRTGSSGVVSLGWLVYYTGSAPPANTDIQVELPLYYNAVDNSLSISPLSEFPGSALVPTTVANLPWAAASNGWVVPVTDALTSTSCATGGGFNYVQCKSDGSNWYPLPSSPVAFSLTTTGTSGAATYQSGTLNIPQYTSSTVATFATGTSPEGITADSSGNIWVANYASNTVREFTGGGAFIRDVSVVASPSSLAPDSSGNVWVGNDDYSNSVSKISSTGSVSGPYATGINISGIALDSSGNIFSVNTGGQKIYKRSPAWADLGDFSIPCQNEAVAIDTTGNAWTRCRNGQSAYEVTTSGTVLGPFAIGSNANNDAGIAADSSGNVWFTNSGDASVTKLSSSGALVGTYPVGGGPIGIAIDSSTGNVFVANQNDNTVTELSSSGVKLNTFPVGAGPYGVAIDPSHNIWVTNYTGNTVSVISLQPPLTWPFQEGIPVYSGSGSWLPSLAPPTGALVGTTDTQTLSNKTVTDLKFTTPLTSCSGHPSGTVVAIGWVSGTTAGVLTVCP